MEAIKRSTVIKTNNQVYFLFSNPLKNFVKKYQKPVFWLIFYGCSFVLLYKVVILTYEKDKMVLQREFFFSI